MKKNLSAEIILKKTLEMIIRQEGASGLNLRKIAKELQCAHTNIYNYYDSYDTLLWRVTAVAMENLSAKIFSENTTEGFVRNYVNYAFENKGLYKLIWYERLNSVMPEGIMEVMSYPSIKATQIFAEEMELKVEEIRKIINIAFSYVHGELTIYLNNRAFIDESHVDTYKEKIIENALSVLYNYQIITGGKK